MIDDLARRAQDVPELVIDDCDWLGRAIDRDALAGRFGSWGMSTVVDEHTGAPVISEGVFTALHERAGLSSAWPIGNAGLLHVYGYLLSTVQTPYGLKRERWLDGTLARAHGFTPDEFVPWARRRTLLTRVTDASSALLARPTRVAESSAGPLVLALSDQAASGSVALVYAVDGGLVTTFPVGSATAVLDEWDADPARLRWNAAGGPASS